MPSFKGPHPSMVSGAGDLEVGKERQDLEKISKLDILTLVADEDLGGSIISTSDEDVSWDGTTTNSTWYSYHGGYHEETGDSWSEQYQAQHDGDLRSYSGRTFYPEDTERDAEEGEATTEDFAYSLLAMKSQMAQGMRYRYPSLSRLESNHPLTKRKPFLLLQVARSGHTTTLQSPGLSVMRSMRS